MAINLILLMSRRTVFNLGLSEQSPQGQSQRLLPQPWFPD